jgi:hypothetical protein
MNQQLALPEPTPDAAAQAFNELRQEISLMRRGMAKFIDEHPPVVVPDYTETLNDIGDFTRSLATSVKKLRETPILQTTPEQIGKQITAVGAEARKGEHDLLMGIAENTTEVSKRLAAYYLSARERAEQDSILLWTAGLSFFAGLVLMWSVMSAVHSVPPDASRAEQTVEKQ